MIAIIGSLIMAGAMSVYMWDETDGQIGWVALIIVLVTCLLQVQ